MSNDRGGPRPHHEKGSVLPAAAPNPLQKTREEWVTELANQGLATSKTTAVPPKEPATEVAGVQETIKLVTQPDAANAALIEAVRANLESRGIDAAFLGAGTDLVARYDAAKSLPLETSGTEVLSPTDREVISQADELFDAVHKALRETRGLDGKDVSALVGDPGTTSTATGARDALRKFVDAAPSRATVLTAAGISDADVAEAQTLVEKLEIIVGHKGVRVVNRQSKAAKVDAALFGLEAWVHTFRGRARLATRGNPAAFEALTAQLPRSERRARSTPAPAPNGGNASGETKPDTKGDSKND